MRVPERTSTNPATIKLVEKYHRDRAEFIRLLGGCCVYCFVSDFSKLEFHHTHDRTWIPKDYARWTRLKKYKQDAKRGIIVLACSRCNKKIGRPSKSDF